MISERVAYAAKVLDGTASIFEMTLAVMTNQTISADPVTQFTDANVEFAVSSVWTAFSLS